MTGRTKNNNFPI